MKKIIYLFSIVSLIISCSADSADDLVQDLKLSNTNISITKGDIEKLEITEGNSPYEIKADNNNVSAILEGNRISIKALMVGKSIITLRDSENKKIVINVSVDRTFGDYQAIKIIDPETEVKILPNITLEKNNVKRIKILGSGNYSFHFDNKLIDLDPIDNKIGFYKIFAKEKGITEIIITDNITKKEDKFKLNVEHLFIVKNGKLISVKEGAIKNGVLVIPPNVTEISGSPKKDVDILTKDQKEKLKEIVFGDHNEDSEISILRYAFKRCYNVEKITFGAKIKKLDIYMFIIDDDDHSRSLVKLKEMVIKKNHNKDLKWVEGTNWHFTFRYYYKQGQEGNVTCSVPADSEYFDINKAWDYFCKETILLIKK